MFSLIITIISVALVAALALATLYYGGSAFNVGSSRAEASKVLLQGQQLLGAADLYFSQNNAWPATLDVLVNEGYLKSIPAAQSSGLSQALAAGTAWQMVPNAPSFYVTTEGSDTCAEINMVGSLKKRGVLKNAYSALPAQCYGDSVFTTVFRKSAGTVFPSLPNVVEGVPPVDPGDLAWKVPPTANQGGQPAGGVLDAPPTLLAVDDVAPGDTGTSQFELRNSGTAPMVFTVAPHLASDASAALSTSSTCGTSLAPNTSCTVTVEAASTSGGNHTGTVLFTLGAVNYSIPVTAYVQSLYWRVNYALGSAQSTGWTTDKSAACSSFLSANATYYASAGYTWTNTNTDADCSASGTKSAYVWQYAITQSQPSYKYPWPSPWFNSREELCDRVEQAHHESNPNYKYTYWTVVENIDPNRPYNTGTCNGYTSYDPSRAWDSYSIAARQTLVTQTLDQAGTFESQLQ